MLVSDQTNLQHYKVFVCPQCQGKLASKPHAYLCAHCKREYPILFGIVDFRIRSDRYLSLEEERAKATRLATATAQNFSSMLDYYYDITDDVPPTLATRYKAYHYNGPNQARHTIESLNVGANDVMLDVGCGTGGALIAAAKNCTHLYGMDIALRWLIICQQRLKEQGVVATLVCADIEAPPFPSRYFSKIVATDLLENVYSVDHTLKSLGALLQSNGKLWLAGSNKFCLGPHPTTRLWAIGYFPVKIRSRLVKYLRGVDSLRFIHLISPALIIRLTKNIGLRVLTLSPRMISLEKGDNYPPIDRLLIRIYIALSRLPILRQLMVWVGPAFEVVLVKPTQPAKQKDVN